MLSQRFADRSGRPRPTPVRPLDGVGGATGRIGDLGQHLDADVDLTVTCGEALEGHHVAGFEFFGLGLGGSCCPASGCYQAPEGIGVDGGAVQQHGESRPSVPRLIPQS